MATDAGADRIFIMAYNYRTALANPVGSTDPLLRADGGLSLTTTLDSYASHGVPAGRILLGLPFYGFTWPTVDDTLNADRRPVADGLGDGDAFFPYRSAQDGLPTGAIVDHDPVERTARITWYDDAKASWYQSYYDDPQSLAPKAKLAISHGLAGMGIWALGYERGVPGYWETIAATFPAPKILSVKVSPNPTDSRSVTVKTTWDAGAHAVTKMRLSNNGSTWSDWRTAAASTSWKVSSTNGTRHVYVQIRDSALARSAVATGKTVLDTVAPTVTSLTLVRQGTEASLEDQLPGVGRDLRCRRLPGALSDRVRHVADAPELHHLDDRLPQDPQALRGHVLGQGQGPRRQLERRSLPPHALTRPRSADALTRPATPIA